MPIMTTEQEVGARLYCFAHVWERYGCPQWIVRTLAEGYRPKFLLLPPLTTRLWVFGRFRAPKREIRASLTKDMLVKGAIEPVKDLSSAGFYSLLFLVPKDSGEFRPVIDLSCLNRHLDIPEGCVFSYTHPSSISEIPTLSGRGRVF